MHLVCEMDTRRYQSALRTTPTAASVPSTKRPCGVLLLLSHIAVPYALSSHTSNIWVSVLFLLMHYFDLCIVAANHTLVTNTAQHLTLVHFLGW